MAQLKRSCNIAFLYCGESVKMSLLSILIKMHGIETQPKFLITGRNEVVAKLIFLHLFVILFTGGCLPQCMLGHPPGTPLGLSTPPETKYTPRD